MNTPVKSNIRLWTRTTLWFLLGVAAITLVVWGQLAVRRVQRDSDLELEAVQSELARIEQIHADYELSSKEKDGLTGQLRADDRAFVRELRSFKRPSMRSALLGKLQLPQENCVVSSSFTLSLGYQKLLIYSSDPGQQLVIPVWQQEEKFGDAKSEPKHNIVIDVPPGELNILEFGLVEDYRSAPYFNVRFANLEKLKIDFPGFRRYKTSSSSSGGQENSALLVPNLVLNGFSGYEDRHIDTTLELLRQGIWLRQHNIALSLSDSQTDATTNLAYCLYWKSSHRLNTTEHVLTRLQLDADDPEQVRYNTDTGLYQIVSPAPSQTDAVSE